MTKHCQRTHTQKKPRKRRSLLILSHFYVCTFRVCLQHKMCWLLFVPNVEQSISSCVHFFFSTFYHNKFNNISWRGRARVAIACEHMLIYFFSPFLEQWWKKNGMQFLCVVVSKGKQTHIQWVKKDCNFNHLKIKDNIKQNDVCECAWKLVRMSEWVRDPYGICVHSIQCIKFSRSHLDGSLRRSSTMIKWSEQIKTERHTQLSFSSNKQNSSKRSKWTFSSRMAAL